MVTGRECSRASHGSSTETAPSGFGGPEWRRTTCPSRVTQRMDPARARGPAGHRRRRRAPRRGADRRGPGRSAVRARLARQLGRVVEPRRLPARAGRPRAAARRHPGRPGPRRDGRRVCRGDPGARLSRKHAAGRVLGPRRRDRRAGVGRGRGVDPWSRPHASGTRRRSAGRDPDRGGRLRADVVADTTSPAYWMVRRSRASSSSSARSRGGSGHRGPPSSASPRPRPSRSRSTSPTRPIPSHASRVEDRTAPGPETLRYLRERYSRLPGPSTARGDRFAQGPGRDRARRAPCDPLCRVRSGPPPARPPDYRSHRYGAL